MSKKSEQLDKEFMDRKIKLEPLIREVRVLGLSTFEQDWIELQLVRAYGLGREETLREWIKTI